MKIEIDSKKISSSSELFDSHIEFNEDISKILNQLEQQLLYGNNSCFLISGYRGTGKTTLIRTLENKITDNKIIFINLNCSKYESYTLVLRKLIREIHLTLSSKKKYNLIKDKDLITNIKLLYEHTFYEVLNTKNTKNLNEFGSKVQMNFSLKDMVKRLLPMVAVTLSSLNISFNFMPVILKNYNIFIFIISMCWFVKDTLKLDSYFEKTKTSLEEINRKSLYDDEIAEYHLKNILKGLKKENIKVVFVFDELDKIEDESEMIKIISDLKPLLLSDLASFFVIAGQRFYYKFLNSSTLDDSIMTSIFSKEIHVPLTNYENLKKFIYLCINDSLNEKKLELFEKYISSLTLNSYGIMRRFINLILQDIRWSDKKSYLYIDENNESIYDAEIEMLDLLTKIIKNEIQNTGYDYGIKDFLSYQLFIWIKRMDFKQINTFKDTDIFNLKEDYSNIYPTWCKFILSDIFKKLIDGLIDKDFLVQKESNDEMEIYYKCTDKWPKNRVLKENNINEKLHKLEIEFLGEMIEFEKLVRIIYEKELSYEIKRKKPLNYILRALCEDGIINKKYLNRDFEILYGLSSKIRHGEELEEKELEYIASGRKNIYIITYELIQGYCYHIINTFLQNNNYNCIRKEQSFVSQDKEIFDFDILANSNNADIIFELKLNSYNKNISFIKQIVIKLMKSLKTYNFVSKKRNKAILIIFSKRKYENFEKIKEEIIKDFSGEDAKLFNDIYIINFTLDKDGLNKKSILNFLEMIVNEINNENEAAVDLEK